MRLLKRAKELRDTRIAHFLVGAAARLGKQDRLTFRDLRSLRDELNALFNALSFNLDRRPFPSSYDPHGQRPAGDPRPDIERLLDSVARESSVLSLPERRPNSWPRRRAKWSERRLRQFNRYRRKFGLPEV